MADSTTLHTYAAFLGNNTSLSIAELAATIPDFTVVRRVGAQIVLFTTTADLKTRDLDTWGGIFLLARQLPVKTPTVKMIPELLLEQMRSVKGKATFSIRGHGVEFAVLHGLYRDCKKLLKKHDIPSRYIGNERKPPVSAQLHDTGIIGGKHGCEIVVLADEENDFLWIGTTVAAQDPDSYTKRDMDKPVRDTRAGLLPPKLAQILLNLGLWTTRNEKTSKRANPQIVVYDPFCGTGVIPMEALLRGWPVLASDVSLKAVNGCEKNLDWVRKEYDIKKRDVPSDVWKQDATKPFDETKTKSLAKTPPDVIVTETMLGPPLTERPTQKDVVTYRRDCEDLEIAFLKNAAATLPGVPIVAMFPVWYVKSGPVHLERVWKQLADIGYNAVLPPGAQPDTPDRPSIVYRRAEQFVGREIVILKPVRG